MKGSEIAVMLGAPKGSSGDEETEESGDAGHEAFKSAASSVMQALEAGDSDAFAENLKDAIEICTGLEEEGEY